LPAHSTTVSVNSFGSADGLFVAGNAGDVDLDEAFDLLATAVLSTARSLAVVPGDRGVAGPLPRAVGVADDLHVVTDKCGVDQVE
jgi:hypothetical protein